ncbi:metal-dependent hydrolase [Halomonas vilamensis]|uniref:Metal-dependent hydrolase n=1 Tax=Vreelandella vilamensis TaxID=531309 RepID=A0ABU1H0U1_9GAMM|nr:metal-dependent hydrolase [Halomonas vilamensis]MDR5897730.1 metal-dependent hydrolase [Halomonas vilamensis]
MDSITQAALGAAIGGTVLGRRLGRKAVLLGAVVGTLPDLDVVLDYGDAIANVTQHRGFSHSLFVLTGLGVLLAWLCARFAPARDISLRRWLTFFLLILLTHPLLDALTTYGTQLFWPLKTPPVAWPIVFIIDPIYSLVLLVALGVAMFTGKIKRRCAWGLALSCAYLMFAMGAKGVVIQRLEPVLATQGIEEAPRLIQPAPFTTLLWRATIIDGDTQYESLIGLLDHKPPVLEPFTRQIDLAGSAVNDRHIQRLRWFAGPFLRYDLQREDEMQTLLVTDVRLGFPGFYPFTYAIANRLDEHATWRPLEISTQLASERGVDQTTLKRLWTRAKGDSGALCAAALVEPRWRLAPAAC